MMMMMKKRKELEGVNDDDHFSLSSSPIKIRRLDAELPPEVQESDIFPQSMLPQPQEENIVVGHVGVGQSSVLINESADNNEDERAIVLFNPMNNTTPFLQSPSAFSVSSDILSGLKNQILLANQSNLLKTSEDNAERQEKNFEGCLAVVPWVPSRLPPTQVSEVQQPDVSEMMEAEDMELVSMDIEDNDIGIVRRPGTEFGGTSANEGLHHWQQQPRVPQNASTPIVWFG